MTPTIKPRPASKIMVAKKVTNQTAYKHNKEAILYWERNFNFFYMYNVHVYAHEITTLSGNEGNRSEIRIIEAI